MSDTLPFGLKVRGTVEAALEGLVDVWFVCRVSIFGFRFSVCGFRGQNMAHIRQSRPDAGLGFTVKVLKTGERCYFF